MILKIGLRGPVLLVLPPFHPELTGDELDEDGCSCHGSGHVTSDLNFLYLSVPILKLCSGDRPLTLKSLRSREDKRLPHVPLPFVLGMT